MKEIAVVGAAAIFLLLGFLLLVPLLEPTSNLGCEELECGGPRFAVGNPIAGICPSGGIFPTKGCVSGDFVYNLAIETSSITFGEVLFQIEIPTGALYDAPGPYSGFVILSPNGSEVAGYQTVGGVMNMTSGWTYYLAGTTTSTPLSNIYTIIVDMGMANPDHQGYEFIARGTGSFSGTAVVALP
jgi:hypothetical protein